MDNLRKDSAELAQLLSSAKSSRVKDALAAAKIGVDKEIALLERKSKRAEICCRPPIKTNIIQKRFLAELTEYAWQQSSTYLKLCVNLKGVEEVPQDNVSVNFDEDAVNLLVINKDGRHYSFTINNLLHSIDIGKSYRKVGTGLVAIYAKKLAEGLYWDCLTTTEKHLNEQRVGELCCGKIQRVPEICDVKDQGISEQSGEKYRRIAELYSGKDNRTGFGTKYQRVPEHNEKKDQRVAKFSEKSPTDEDGKVLVKLMKNMYNRGDDQVKKAVAKTWEEGQQKIMATD